MKGTKIQYRPSGSTAGSDKEKDSPPVQSLNLGDTIKKPKSISVKQRSSPSHPSKPKVVTGHLTATAHQNTTTTASTASSIMLPPSAPLPVPIPFNFYSDNTDTPDKPSQPTVWDQAIADSGYSGSGNRVLPLSPAEMASSVGLRNNGYNTGFKAPLLYSGLPSGNSSASPTTRLQKDFQNISMGLASYQRDDDDLDNNNDPNDDFGVDMLEMRPRRPLTRNGSQRSIAGSISSASSSSSNLASGGTGGSSLFTTRTGGTATTAASGVGAAYNYGYGTPTLTSSPEIGFTKSPTTTALGISGLNRTRRGSSRNNPPLALPFSQQYAQATLYNNSTGFSCPSPETALSGLPIHGTPAQQNQTISPRQQQQGSLSTASPLSHLSNYFISPTSLALNGQRAFPYTSLSGSPSQSFMPTTARLGMSAELASTSFGERHAQKSLGGIAFPHQQQHLHGPGQMGSTAVKPFNTPPPKRADTSSTSVEKCDTSASTPTCGTPDDSTPLADEAAPQKTLPDLTDTKIKLADLGNAIFFNEMKGRNALPEFVCTRQYRPLENLIGAPYDQGIDVWATACVVFEMLTGDLLFNPGSKRFKWSKEDDLLAQQIELLGPLPQHLLNAGKKTSQYFNPTGKLLKLKLKPWSLKDVLVEKYKMSAKQADDLADFLLPMLAMDPASRCSADEALQHPWLSSDPDDDTVLYRPPPPVLKLADPEVERKKREERAAARAKEEADLIAWREEAQRREEEYERLEQERKRLAEEEEDRRFWAQEKERERRRMGIFEPPKDQEDDDDSSYPWGYPLRRYP